jgi:hypothetical protein
VAGPAALVAASPVGERLTAGAAIVDQPASSSLA